MKELLTGTEKVSDVDYQKTGIEWLSRIPRHWQIRKGKWLFRKMERPVRKDDEIITCFRDGQVTLRINRKTEGFTNALKEHGYQGIRKGDLVIHAMDAFAGAIGVSDSDGKATPVYSVCTPREPGTVDPNFYAYLLRNLAKVGFIESLAKGIRERSTDFRFGDFALLPLPFPPLREQTRIAQFLDRKTAQIDKAIAQKERLIELLKERRQILIHHAVTKGLNPNVKMKDSGVEWIGQIPEHWEVRRLKYVCDINKDSLQEDTAPNFRFQYVDIGSVTFGEGLTRTEHFTFKDAPSRARRIAKMGDTVISTVRTYLKAIDYIDAEKSSFIYSTGFAVLHPHKQVIAPEFLAYCVRSDSFTNQVTNMSKGMSYPAINSTELGRLLIALAPIEEQVRIVEYVSYSSARIQQAITTIDNQIRALQSFKESIVDEAVTGKIRVTRR